MVQTGSLKPCLSALLAEGKNPPFFDIHIAPVDAVVGDSADFECHVTGTQPIKVSWAKDNREIRSGGNYQISYLENTAHLTILKVDKGDSGQYTCHAVNEVGKDSCTAQLNIKGMVYFACVRQNVIIFYSKCAVFRTNVIKDTFLKTNGMKMINRM